MKCQGKIKTTLVQNISAVAPVVHLGRGPKLNLTLINHPSTRGIIGTATEIV